MAISVRLSRSLKRAWSWFFLAMVVAAGLLLVLYFGLPAYLNTASYRSKLLGQANAVLAPASLTFDRIRFSWWSPTEISGLALTSKEGKPVVSSSRASWDRTLGQIILDRSNLGTLTLLGSSLDVKRFADGSIDLQEVIEPILVDDPRLALRINIIDGRLKFQSPSLGSPLSAALPSLVLRIGPAPHPTTWRLVLAQDPLQTLDIEGVFDKWRPDPEGRLSTDLSVKANRWPFQSEDAGRAALAGTIEGEMRAHRRSGFWETEGKAHIDGLEAHGAVLGTDRPRLERVNLDWRARETKTGWNVANAALKSELGSLQGHGEASLNNLGPLEVVATLDLSALVRKLPKTLSLLKSTPLDGSKLLIKAESKAKAETPSLDLEARLIEAGPRLEAGVSESLKQTVMSARMLHPSEHRWELAPLAWTTPFGNLRASGLVGRDDPGKAWNYRAEGSIELDWSDLAVRLRDASDPKAELAGKSPTFQISGSMPDIGDPSLSAELRLGVESADIYGLEIGETDVILKLRDGRPRFDPIDMIVNQGKVHLEPSIDRDVNTKNWAIRLGKESFFSGIVVNDVVSSRFLSFAAPILDRATSVTGKISATIEEAVFPLGGDKKEAPVFRGEVEFEDLTFFPGPLAKELLGIVGRTGERGLSLNQPVSLSIADRRVFQKGLAIPIGDVSKVSLEGSVDFDKNLDLVATIPLTSAMLGGRPVLGDIIDGTKVEIPITGTLDKPKIDAEAFNLAFKDFSKTLLTKGLFRGASEILTRMITPRDPNAPPPPPRLSAEERKAQRLQNQAERRKRRGQEP